MNNLKKTILASLGLVAALLIGLCIKNDVLFLVVLKGVLISIMIIALLMYYGFIRVSEFRRKHIQKTYWYLYVSVTAFLLLGHA